MQSLRYKFSSDSCKLSGGTLFTIILFAVQVLWNFHRIDAIFDKLLICNCRHLFLRTGILYDCYLFIQEFLAYTNREQK